MKEYRYSKRLPVLMLILGIVFIVEITYSNWNQRLSFAANVIQAFAVLACLALAVYIRRYVVQISHDSFTVKSWNTVSYGFSSIKSIASSDVKGGTRASISMIDGSKIDLSSDLPEFKLLISAIRENSSIPKKVWEPV